MSVHREIPPVSVTLGAALTDVIQIDVGGIDVVLLDIENKGSAAVTSWALMARVSRSAPFRDVTPASLKTADGYQVVRAANTELATLAAGAWLQVGLNVSLYESIRIRAAGAGALLVAAAGGAV